MAIDQASSAASWRAAGPAHARALRRSLLDEERPVPDDDDFASAPTVNRSGLAVRSSSSRLRS